MQKTRFRLFSLAVSAACLLAVHHVSAQVPFISDGSFESPAEAPNSLNNFTGQSFNGWSGNGLPGEGEYVINGNIQDLSGNNYGITPYGSQYLGLNAVYRNSFRSIESQTVTGLTPGQAYTLTLYIANLDGAGDPKISLTVEFNATGNVPVGGSPDASALFTAPIEGPYGDGTIDFVPETLTFTPTDDTITFNIGNQSKQGTMGIDNVSLVAVPEPKTAAMVAMGAIALAGVAFRRRRAR